MPHAAAELSRAVVLYGRVGTYEVRTASLKKRVPKKALSKMAVVVRSNLSWLLIAAVFFGSLAAIFVFGIHFEDPKFFTVLLGWGGSLGVTWLMIEPSAIFVMVIVPRLVDKAMTPAGARTKDQEAAAKKPKRSRWPTRRIPTLQGPMAMGARRLKSKRSADKYAA